MSDKITPLKPCPFVLVRKELPHDVYYNPENGRMECLCGACGPVGAFTEDTAVSAWNTRTTNAYPGLVEVGMRAIKFRAWDKKFKKMYHEGFFIGADGDISFDPKIFKRPSYDPLAIEVMQFTELKDKNGVEIYEGDICQEWLTDFNKGLLYKIGFSDGMFTMTAKNGYDRTGIWNVYSRLEVIGNIHQNPELIRKR